jgi:hypothetical protein
MCAERGAPCDPLQVPQPSLKHAGPWPSPPLIRLRTLVHTPTQYDESRATPSPRSIYTLRSCNIPPKPNNHTLVVSLWHRGDCDCWPPIARLEDAAGAVLLGLHARLARLCGHLVGHLELQGIREVSQGFRRHTGCAGALRTGCSDSSAAVLSTALPSQGGAYNVALVLGGHLVRVHLLHPRGKPVDMKLHAHIPAEARGVTTPPHPGTLSTWAMSSPSASIA